MTCAKCEQEMLGHFKVERINRAGQAEISTALCSVPCLLGWGTQYAQMAGMKMAFGVQQKISEAKGMWDALKRVVKGS